MDVGLEARETPVNILLIGLAAEELKKSTYTVTGKSPTPLNVINEIASLVPSVKDLIVRADGHPRLSTKIQVNGAPPSDLNMPLKDGDIIIVSTIKPCDG